jgi:hypothetical protein
MPFTSEQELAGAVNNILAGLGDSSEQVAASLREKGIKGEPACAEQCPIARLLKSEIEDAEWASVSACGLHVGAGDFTAGMATPDHVADFVSDFDLGQFPDLEAD